MHALSRARGGECLSTEFVNTTTQRVGRPITSGVVGSGSGVSRLPVNSSAAVCRPHGDGVAPPASALPTAALGKRALGVLPVEVGEQPQRAELRVTEAALEASPTSLCLLELDHLRDPGFEVVRSDDDVRDAWIAAEHDEPTVKRVASWASDRARAGGAARDWACARAGRPSRGLVGGEAGEGGAQGRGGRVAGRDGAAEGGPGLVHAARDRPLWRTRAIRVRWSRRPRGVGQPPSLVNRKSTRNMPHGLPAGRC